MFGHVKILKFFINTSEFQILHSDFHENSFYYRVPLIDGILPRSESPFVSYLPFSFEFWTLYSRGTTTVRTLISGIDLKGQFKMNLRK